MANLLDLVEVPSPASNLIWAFLNPTSVVQRQSRVCWRFRRAACANLTVLKMLSKPVDPSRIDNDSIDAIMTFAQRSLRCIDLPDTSISDLHPLASCVHLHTLILTGCGSITDLSPLSECTQLRHIDLSNCQLLNNIVPLSHCLRLQHLAIRSIRINNIAPLAHCSDMRFLDLAYTGTAHLKHLSQLTRLESLQLDGCELLSDLSPLSSCISIKLISINFCSAILDISPLGSCSALEDLSMRHTFVYDLRPLSSCSHLNVAQTLFGMALQFTHPWQWCSYHDNGRRALIAEAIADGWPFWKGERRSGLIRQLSAMIAASECVCNLC